jgi:O-glycosyl hydrolase
LESRVFLSAVSVAINSNTRYQQIDGFGSADSSSSAGLYETAAFQKMYYQDLGSSMLRLPLQIDALEGAGATITSPVTLGTDLQANISMFNFQQQDVQADGSLAAASKTYALDSFKLIGTVFSPPEWMKGTELDPFSGQPNGNQPTITYNNTQSSGGSLEDNPANLAQFGRWIAAYVAGFQQTFGVQFYAISIQNELAFSEPYNSCVYTPQIYVDAIKAVHNAFVEYGITTKIMGPEDVGVGSTDVPWILWRQMQYINAVRADPVAMADLDIYAIHGYADDSVTPGHSTEMWNEYVNGRSAAAFPYPYNAWFTGIGSDGKESWMTEASSASQTSQGALQIAENAQDALVHGNVNAWLAWQTSTFDPASQFTLTTGTDENNENFAAAQQFFRYIRPGSYRVDASPSDPTGVYASAYIQDQQHTLTTVLINAGATDQTVNLSFLGAGVSSFNVDHMTDATHNFVDQGPVTVTNGIATINLPAQSIITLQGSTLIVAPAVTGLTALAASAQVTLKWNPSTGAASYNVERGSVSGGPYTTVATGVTGITYTDMGLTNGTNYFYVVAAVNAAGVSPVSNEVIATPVAAISGGANSIFSASAAPIGNLQNVGDPNIVAHGGVELGTKFRSDVAGTITGVRFWKGSQNNGPHTGELWSSTGQLLASATFMDPALSGWQQVNFSGPVAITANTTYIVSYHTTAGFIAYAPNAFTIGGIDNAPLHALANGVDGNNGVYSYDTTPGVSNFPTSYNSQSPNYWVDVVFSPTSATNSIFAATSAPAGNLQNVNDATIAVDGGVELGLKFRSDVAGTVTGVRFWKGSQETGAQTGELWSNAGQLLASATFLNETPSGWQQVIFSSAVVIAANTTYIVSYHTTSAFIAYTPNTLASAGIDNSPLHALANGVDGNNGVYRYDTTPGVSGFPTSFNSQSPNYWVDVVFNTSSPIDTIFGTSAPAAGLQNVNDPTITADGGVELGIKFRSDVAGTVTGARFFKGSLETGAQTGELWSSAGVLLASATFLNETPSGWQQVSFSSPVAITANTTYIVSYHTTSAYIAYTPSVFASGGVDSSPLHAVANGVDGNNGVYRYDTTPGAPGFPTSFNGQSPNYWVDVIFTPSP